MSDTVAMIVLAAYAVGVTIGLATALWPKKPKQPSVPKEFRVPELREGPVNKGGINDLSYVDTRDRPPPPGSMRPNPLGKPHKKGL